MKKLLKILLVFSLVFGMSMSALAAANSANAVKSSQKVLLDRKEVSLPAYLINSKNYIKLRDFAAILSESGKKFNVSFDASKKSIVIKTGEGYAKTSEDLKTITNKKASASLVTNDIIVNGKNLKANGANINGFNYLQIREAAKLVGVEISYNEKTKTVEINTNKAHGKMKCDDKTCSCKNHEKEGFDKNNCCGNKNESNSNVNCENGTCKKSEGKDIRYKCCEECGCAHKTMEEYKKCPCCKWNPDHPVVFEKK
ncbi:copper amine oxidase N-terminal domain-containing protein [uncultured Peptoniphilus sp.]|uniref:copper amine oxidase N-terminal domain-containing protein n=1 Tax=uncultured Peptoniphilus sp. TaxID=254354 RepID=UPI0028065431|nr:copper amine oxidase N-terminal domain-containing protein [uncultured Peptoniphilus sp.]